MKGTDHTEWAIGGKSVASCAHVTASPCHSVWIHQCIPIQKSHVSCRAIEPGFFTTLTRSPGEEGPRKGLIVGVFFLVLPLVMSWYHVFISECLRKSFFPCVNSDSMNEVVGHDQGHYMFALMSLLHLVLQCSQIKIVCACHQLSGLALSPLLHRQVALWQVELHFRLLRDWVIDAGCIDVSFLPRLSCHISPCHVPMFYLATSPCAMNCDVMSYHSMLTSCHASSCPASSCHVVSCHVSSCHVASCHISSCHGVVMPCYVPFTCLFNVTATTCLI